MNSHATPHGTAARSRDAPTQAPHTTPTRRASRARPAAFGGTIAHVACCRWIDPRSAMGGCRDRGVLRGIAPRSAMGGCRGRGVLHSRPAVRVGKPPGVARVCARMRPPSGAPVGRTIVGAVATTRSLPRVRTTTNNGRTMRPRGNVARRVRASPRMRGGHGVGRGVTPRRWGNNHAQVASPMTVRPTGAPEGGRILAQTRATPGGFPTRTAGRECNTPRSRHPPIADRGSIPCNTPRPRHPPIANRGRADRNDARRRVACGARAHRGVYGFRHPRPMDHARRHRRHRRRGVRPRPRRRVSPSPVVSGQRAAEGHHVLKARVGVFVERA